jgi:predicted SAM-dependent methyltransferase
VPTRFQSKWANRAAQAGITLAAIGLFLAFRPDIFGYTRDHLTADFREKVATPGIIADYLKQNPKPKIQIGAGESHAAGWLNTDIEPTAGQAFLDATRPLPFADGSVAYIFGEHVIEHITYDQALGFLKEAHRVLAPGGKIRMVTPNLLQFVSLFQEPNPKYIARKLDFHSWPVDSPDPEALVLNNEMHWFGHQFLYTPKLLKASYAQAGFADVRHYHAGETSDEVFKEVELRSQGDWRDVNLFEAMAIEAVK